MGLKGLIRRSGRSTLPLRNTGLAAGMTVGLFGGTFDPPHAGHLHVARLAKKRLGLDRVWWLASPQNPLKSRLARPLDMRLMEIAALANDPGMVPTDLEDRMGIRHTYDLVSALTRRYPKVKFVWLMGADNLAGFHKWGEWRDILHTLPIAVIARPQDAVRARLAPVARLQAHSRIRDNEIRTLPLRKAPAWSYLIGRFHYQSSSALRAGTF